MKRKLFALFFALAASIGLSWGATVVTFTLDDLPSSGRVLTKDGVTLTAGVLVTVPGDPEYGNIYQGGTFRTDLGNFVSIEVQAYELTIDEASGWTGSATNMTWTGSASEVTFNGNVVTFGEGFTITCTIEEAAPQRYTAPVKAEDLIVGDTLAQGALLSTQRYEGFWFATGRARYHGQVVTRDYLCSFERLGAVSKHGAIDSEAMGYRGCFEPINENGQLGEEWVVTSVSPFTIAGIGTAVITNTNYTSAVDYAVIEPGDTLSEGALIQNGPTIYWMLQDRVYYNDIPRDESDTYLERYHTIGQNGVFEDGGGIIKPRNEQGEEGSKWLVVYYSPLTLAGIGAPSMTLTLAENVSIVGLPIDGITDKGNGVYEVVKGTVFSVQAAEPEHYTFDHWSDLGSADPQYSNNPRTITMTGNMNLTPVYNIDTYSLTIGVNDPARGSVKIAPTTQKVVWSKEHLQTIYEWKYNNPRAVAWEEHRNNEKDGISINATPIVSEVGLMSDSYYDFKPLMFFYDVNASITFNSNIYTFKSIEIYGEHSANFNGWTYNTAKGCYQVSGLGNTVSLTPTEGAEIYQFVDSIIFYANSALPQGVTPTETPGVYSVQHGSEVSFVAVPASEEYYLVKWNDQPATSDTLTLTITGEQTVSAYFAHVPYIYTLPEGLSIVGLPIDGIEDKGNGVYAVAEGTQFQVSIDSIPAHYHFAGWADLDAEDEQYAANPRTITADSTMTLEPIFAIDTYTLTLATNDSTKGVVKVLGGAGGVRETIILKNKGAEDPIQGEYFQVSGGGTDNFGRYIGRTDGYSLTISSLNGEMIDSISFSVTATSMWSGYTVSSTSGEVVDNVFGNYTFKVKNINATSVTISRIGDGDPSGSITVDVLYVNQDMPVRAEITDMEFPTSGNTLTIADMTLTVGSFDLNTPKITGGGTFTTDLGEFTAISIYSYGFDGFAGEGWIGDMYTQRWTGQSSSVSFEGMVFGDGIGSITITYTIVPAPAATGGIVDNGDGTYTVDWGTELTFVAQPAENHHLVSWNGEPALSDTLRLTMEGELSVNATFAHDPYVYTLPETVSMVEPLPAGVTDKGNGVYEIEPGTEFQVSANIPEHYHIAGWADLDAEDAAYLANPRTITADSTMTLEPIFAIDTYTLTLATNDSTKGVVSVEGAGAGVDIVWDANFWNGIQAYMNGEDIVHANNSKDGITITFDGGDFENGLKDGKIKLDNSDNKLIFTSTVGEFTKIFLKGYVPGNAPEGWDRVAGLIWEVTPSATVELPGSAALVEFEEAVFTLTSAASGIVDNGDGTYTVDWGTELTFVAQPTEGFMLESWSNGAEVTGDTLKLTMTEELSLTANFKYIPAVITLPDGVNIVEPVPAGITDNGDGTYTVEHGTEFQVSVDSIPAHYHFDHWADLDAEDEQYAANPRTIVAGENLTIEPIFAIDTYTLTLATNDSTKGIVTLANVGQGGEGEAIVWDANFWNGIQAYMNGEDIVHANNSKDGITITFDGGDFENGLKDGQIKLDNSDNKLIFTSTVGEFTKIFLKGYVPGNAPEGWDRVAGLIWEVTPSATVELPGSAALVEFEEAVFTLTSAASGIVDNGDGTYTVDWGTELTFVAQPAENYHLDSWWNGGFAETGDTLRITLEGDTTVNAYFKHDTYILSVEGTEIETAKFYDGTDSVVVLNPGTLIGVVEGDSVLLTTTANYSSANIGEDLTITVHYDIKVVSTQDDYEYALAITDSIYPIKGFIIEPLTPDAEAEAEEEEAENKEGLEIQAYGYCNGSSYSIKYHLKSGNPDQYKIDFADARFTDVDWTDLTTNGSDGTIDVEIPVDLPTGDYSMTVTFRDSRFTWLESEPITVSLHVNLPETYIVALFDNVIAVVDTCECLTDIQWYWRADATQSWTLIEGATGYYYKQEGGLSGEYFIKAKMNGIDTYTCPQDDMSLYGDGQQAKVSAYPNPVLNTTTVTIENSRAWNHTIRIVNLMGNEMMTGSFEGNETTIDMSGYSIGNYMISVDGIVVKVMKK